MTPIFEMHKLGWIQIDPAKPINEQVAVGDYVVSTDMHIYDDKGQSFTLNEVDPEFVCVDLSRTWFQLKFQEEDGTCYNNEDKFIFFVLKSEINYVNVKVPDFMLDKVKQLGGIELDDLRDIDLSHCLDIGII